MKIVGFLGAYNKTDLILYVAKMLNVTNKKVLIIDATMEQGFKYTLPAINPTVSYVTNFQDIDVAIGFNDYTSIAKYIGTPKLDYDFILIDTNQNETFEQFQLRQASKNYFVTSFSLYSIKKGLEILNKLNSPINLSKILFTKDVTNEEDNYLNYISSGYKVNWDKYRIYFPLDSGDQTAMIENEKLSRIRFKNLSQQYRDSLQYIAEELLGPGEIQNLNRGLRNYEKGEL